jgi:hypothetical protein
MGRVGQGGRGKSWQRGKEGRKGRKGRERKEGREGRRREGGKANLGAAVGQEGKQIQKGTLLRGGRRELLHHHPQELHYSRWHG